MSSTNDVSPPPPQPASKGPSLPPGLVARAVNLIMRPGDEWARIEAETATPKSLYLGYVLYLAAVPALAHLIGSLVFGQSMLGITYRPSVGGAISGALVNYLLTLGTVFILAKVIDALAPNFGGQKDPVQAFKVAAYFPTAAWLAGVAAILPPLWALSILGLYSAYLLYKGLPPLMKAPDDKAMAYTAVVLVIGLVCMLIVNSIAMSVTGSGGGSMFGGRESGRLSGKIAVPGVGAIDVGKLDAAAKQMEAAAEAQRTGKPNPAAVKPVDPEALAALLPASLGGFTRGDVSSTSGGAAGLQGSNAEARYSRGDQSFSLTVTDMGTAAPFAALGRALDVHHSERRGGFYEKIGKVDGAMTTERWDTATSEGSYGVLVADRFMVQAEGRAGSVDDLKNAVRAVDRGRLAALARTRG